jgi:ATP phosphoribosyltransferase
MSNILQFGVPKGSLENATIELFKKAGWQISVSSRSYFPGVDDADMSCKLIRPQEMGKYVERGTIDAGIAGRDWVRENDSDVVEVCEMVYSKVSRRPARWVLVVTQDSKVQKPEDLHGATISTELVEFTKRYFSERHIPVTVEFSWGATEAKVVDGLCDAIVEVTETGATIKANGLRIVCDLMESVPIMIANKNAWADPWKREKMVGLKMNAPGNLVEKIIKVLPSLKNPTVANHYNSDWVSIESVLNEKEVRRIIPELIKLGAEGIIEYPLNKII